MSTTPEVLWWVCEKRSIPVPSELESSINFSTMSRIVGSKKIIQDIAGVVPYAYSHNALSGMVTPLIQMVTGINPWVKHTHTELSKYGRLHVIGAHGCTARLCMGPV